MSHLIAFAFGLMIGVPLGMLALGLCIAAKRGEWSGR